jgi:hypothetical protein
LITSNLKFKTRKASHQINSDSSSPVNNLKMVERCLTTTFRKSRHYTLSFVYEGECQSKRRLVLFPIALQHKFVLSAIAPFVRENFALNIVYLKTISVQG